MKNAYIYAVALDALHDQYITAVKNGADAASLAGRHDNIINFAVAVGYYYTDEIKMYLTSWNDHDITRMLDAAQIAAHNDAVDYQLTYCESVTSWAAEETLEDIREAVKEMRQEVRSIPTWRQYERIDV